MFMGVSQFPQYMFHRYRRKHPHRPTTLTKRKLPGFPDWWVADSYSRLIEKTNKRRKVCLRSQKKPKLKQWKP